MSTASTTDMRVLITGGSGFVGLAVAEALLESGIPAIGLDRSQPPAAIRRHFEKLGPGYAVVEGDIRTAGPLEAVLRAHGITHLVHGAAVTAGRARELQDTRGVAEVNVLGTVSALEAARSVGIERMIHLSSVAVYGAAAFGPSPLDEETTIPQPDSVYAVTKHAGEGLCLRMRERTGLDVRVVRLSSVFGPWERETGLRDTMSPPLQIMRLARARRRAVLPRAGTRDWLYSRDVGAGVRALLEAPRIEADILNLGIGESWSLLDFGRRLAGRFAGFDITLAGPGAPADIDLYGDRDRAPLAIERLQRTIGHRLRFGCEAAALDYADWVQAHPEVAEACFAT